MERLHQLRKEKRMSQVRLGIEADVSQETISGYEKGRVIPPADMLIRLADILNTSVDYLLERTDEKTFQPIRKSDLTDREIELFGIFRSLPENKKERALGMIMGLSQQEK